MATFEIGTVTVSADGWSADVALVGQAAERGNITYDFGLGANNDPTNATFVLTVFSNGFNESGGGANVERTVYGTQVVRLPYPDQAELDETNPGLDLIVRVALSEFVYPDFQAETANIAAGWAEITSGPNTGNTSTAQSTIIANNSTFAYPKVIGNWAWPGSSVVSDDIEVEFAAFHAFAKEGKQVAAIKFEAVDESAHSITPIFVTEMVKSDKGETNCVQIYKSTIPVASFTDGDIITVKATVYPLVGDAGAVLDTDDAVNTFPTAKYTNQFYRYNTDAHGHCVVDASNGVDISGDVYISQAAAEAAHTGDPTTAFATIAAALTAVQAFNNAEIATVALRHNDAGGGNIYLTQEIHDLDSTNGGTQTEWVTLQPITGASKAGTKLNSPGANSDFPLYLKLNGITVETVEYWKGNDTDSMWIHNCTMNTTNAFPLTVYACPYNACTFTSGTMARGFKDWTGPSPTEWSVIRGCSFSGYASDDFTAVTMALGNEGVLVSGRQGAQALNTVCAYNTYFDGTLVEPFILSDLFDIEGFAFVQNVVERASGNSMIVRMSGDGTVNNSNNIVMCYNTYAGQRHNFLYNNIGILSTPHNNCFIKGDNIDSFNNKDDTFGFDVVVTDIVNNGGGKITITHDGGTNIRNSTEEYVTLAGTSGYDGTWQVITSGNNTTDLDKAYGADELGITASGTTKQAGRIGSWPVGYHVGHFGNVLRTAANDEWIGEFVGLNTPAGTQATPLTMAYVDDNSLSGDGGGNGDYHLTVDSPGVGLMIDILLPFDIEGNARFIDSATNGGAAGAYEFGTQPDGDSKGLRGRLKGDYRSRYHRSGRY